MRKNIIILMLVFVILILLSCNASDAGNGMDGSDANDELGLSANEAAEENNGGRESSPDTLPDLDFNGASLRILMRDGEMFIDEIFAEDEIGEIVNDAVYHRNLSVEERLNMSFEYIIRGQDGFNAAIRNSVNSGGDDYDLTAGFAYYIPPLALEGLFLNWHNIPYIDLEQPWWSADCVSELTVSGKLYFVTGDISLALIQSLYVYYFNKQMAQNFEAPDFYQLVLDGKWTFAAFAEIAKSIKNDLNGDGIFDTNDQFGYAAWEFANVDGYFAAFAQPITAKNDEGYPELVVNTERTANIIDMVRDLFDSQIYYSRADKDIIVPNMFMNRQNLFFYSRLYDSGTTFKDMEDDFGILPPPKYDEHQQNYQTVSHDIYSLFSVPITNNRRELAGAAAEAMAAESYRKVTPAYFETALKMKYSRDEESSQMLDIILNGATFNFGVVYSNALDNVGYIMRDLLLFGDRNRSFAEYWERREARYEAILSGAVDKFLDLSGE